MEALKTLLMLATGYALAIVGVVIGLVWTLAVLILTPRELLSFGQFVPGLGMGVVIALLGLSLSAVAKRRN